MIEPIIYRIGPGRIIDDLAVFDLNTPDPEYSFDNVSALALRSFNFGRCFNKTETNSVSNFPLVFDTGESTGLSPFKSDFFMTIKMSHWCQRNCRRWLNFGRWYHFTEVYYSLCYYYLPPGPLLSHA